MDEEEYFRGIEEHFARKTGNPWPRKPKELKLIDEWFEAQIPMEIVIRGIDHAFEKGKDTEEKEISSLLYCKRFVKNVYKKHLKSMEGKDVSAESLPEAKNVGEYLAGLADSLGKSSARAAESGNNALSEFLSQQHEKMTGIVQSFDPKSQNDLQRVEQQLTGIEKEIETVLLTMISEQQMLQFKEDAMRELKTFEDKLDLAVYQEMLRRALIKSTRKLYHIPRLSLFYM